MLLTYDGQVGRSAHPDNKSMYITTKKVEMLYTMLANIVYIFIHNDQHWPLAGTWIGRESNAVDRICDVWWEG